MSYSRGCGRGEISCASRISSSVVSPIAERTPTTRWPSSRARTRRRATSLIFSVSATEEPPNFITTRLWPDAAASAATSGTGSCCAVAIYISRRPESARPSVTSSAYSRSPPTGSPLARRVTRTRSRSLPGEVGRRRLARRVRVRGEDDLDHAVALDAVHELVDPQVLGLDAVERRERAAEDVVEAAVLRRPLERDEVDRLLDDADRRPVAPRVEADRAQLVLGEVAALAAEADALLHLLDRARRARAPPPSGVWRRWNASRCAVRLPIPGRRVSCATRFSTEGLSIRRRVLVPLRTRPVPGTGRVRLDGR